MNTHEFQFKTNNLLTGQVRSVMLVPDRVAKIIDEGYAIALYPVDTGDFVMWAEPMYLFDRRRLEKKVVEYHQTTKILVDNEQTRSSATPAQQSKLDFEFFGTYQTHINDALTIDQWVIDTATRQQIIDWAQVNAIPFVSAS